ncbi:hypothetical protein [Palleronia abyssalis]|uniref:LysR substrate-binding domain-containing protein n=1 Tax=Palleronia abyssalis TaxID=1501240 RepID=A0A2R8BRE0_9RHOB|nr:hypothetical protein [Palleronia abyssalis]SPJ22720.1 hypothetical protein PAA8504_00517 [Palleronia abyssalis]
MAVEVVEGLGSSGANRAVIAGALDVSIPGRPLKLAEKDAGLVARPLPNTAFALFTSRKEPVDIPSSRVWELYENPHNAE